MTSNSSVFRFADGGRSQPRVLYVADNQLQIGEPQFRNEIDALEKHYDIHILVRRKLKSLLSSQPNLTVAEGIEARSSLVREFQPDVLHTHGLTALPLVDQLADMTDTPFTVRVSFSDALALRNRGLATRLKQMLMGETPIESEAWFNDALRAARSDLCLGLLIPSGTRACFEQAGFPADKLSECFPLIHFDRFHDRSPNGPAVMNIEKAGEAKAVSDYFELASLTPATSFSLYADGDAIERATMLNRQFSTHMRIVERPSPQEMASEYKKHRWIVFTAETSNPDPVSPNVIAEAQAAGVGICLSGVRSDLAQHLGDGAGVLYESIDELPGIVAGSVPEEMRERGFEQARKSDLGFHRQQLNQLWATATEEGPTAMPVEVSEDLEVRQSV